MSEQEAKEAVPAEAAPVEAVRPAAPDLPKHLQKIKLPLGVHRAAIKAGFFGADKAGKSYALASFPSPKVVLDGGHGGIAPYCDPESGDTVLEVTEPDEILDATSYVLKNQQHYASVIFDDNTNMWANWHESWAKANIDRDGEAEWEAAEIKAQHWRKIKGPWKALYRRVDASRLHTGLGFRLKDIMYVQEGEGKNSTISEIRRIVNPDVEKSIPYIFDLMFYCEQLVNRQNMPEPRHKITLFKARIPRSMVEELRIGKQWKFEDSARLSPWQVIFEPMLPQWKRGGSEFLGIDPGEHETQTKQMAAAAADQDLGAAMQVIDRPVKTLQEYGELWSREILPLIQDLDTGRKAAAMKAHEAKKISLGWTGEKK